MARSSRKAGAGGAKIRTKGRSLTIEEWSRKTGISVPAIRARLREGWPPGRAVSEPVGRHVLADRSAVKLRGIRFPLELDRALNHAMDRLEMDRTHIVREALAEYLYEHGITTKAGKLRRRRG